MNSSVIKLVDAALLPAAIMVLGKFLGMILVLWIFQIPWTLEQASQNVGMFGITPGIEAADVITASTYSDIFLYTIMAVGFSLVLFRVTVLSTHRITPKMLVRLSNANLLGLVKSSYDLYHQASVWTLFLWVTALTIIVNVALGKTEPWVALAAIAANILFTSLILQDVYKEIEGGRKNLGKHSAF